MGNKRRIMTDHECEWGLTVGHSNCKACHYSAIEGVACCTHCNDSIGPTEIERRLNEHAALKRDIAAKADIIQVMEDDIACVPKGQNVTEYVTKLKRVRDAAKALVDEDMTIGPKTRELEEALADTQEKEVANE